MLKNRELVYEKAEEMAEKYRQKLLAEAEGRPIEEEILDIPPALEEIEDDLAIAATEDE
jgi:small subunit ribosomal protein S1